MLIESSNNLGIIEDNSIRCHHYPVYEKDDSAENRIAKCIQFELTHGGNHISGAKAIIRDIKWGYIKLDEHNDKTDNSTR